MKFQVLKKHGLDLSQDQVERIVRQPLGVLEGYQGRRVAQGNLDVERVLRVVYEESPGEVLIITFYPGRRERYE